MNLLPIILCSLGIGCGAELTGDAQIDIPNCRDADCRVTVAVAAWDRGHQPGLAALGLLEQPEERLLVARQVLESGRPVPPEMCDLVDPASREYCQRLTHRPHLFEEPRPTAQSRVRSAGGPTDTELLPTVELRATVLDLEAAGSCAADDDACADEVALAAAKAGKLEDAARACLLIPEGKWRSECMFQAAETGVRWHGGPAYALASELCLAAGEFRPHCLGHLIQQLSTRAPPADIRGSQAWQEPLAIAQTVESTWSGRDAALGSLVVDRFWAETLYVSYRTARVLGGNPLDALPPVAVPHVRAGLAQRLLQLEPAGSRDLAAWVSRAQELLAVRSGVPPRPGENRPPPVVRNLWENDLPRDQAFAAIFYMGPARRTTVADEAVDLTLCLLEAAARLQPKASHLIAQARQHPDAAVRWTAERLSR